MTKINQKIINKRNKNEISIDIKRSIQKHYKDNKPNNKKYTQENMIDFFEKELGFRIPKSTLSEIISNKYGEWNVNDESKSES